MLDWFADKWNSFIDFIVNIPTLLTNVVIWTFESTCNLAITALNSLNDLLSIIDVTRYLSALPSEIINIMALLGVDTASSMLVSAILIRITLQLIPFTRLGS